MLSRDAAHESTGGGAGATAGHKTPFEDEQAEIEGDRAEIVARSSEIGARARPACTCASIPASSTSAMPSRFGGGDGTTTSAKAIASEASDGAVRAEPLLSSELARESGGVAPPLKRPSCEIREIMGGKQRTRWLRGRTLSCGGDQGRSGG